MQGGSKGSGLACFVRMFLILFMGFSLVVDREDTTLIRCRRTQIRSI